MQQAAFPTQADLDQAGARIASYLNEALATLPAGVLLTLEAARLMAVAGAGHQSAASTGADNT